MAKDQLIPLTEFNYKNLKRKKWLFIICLSDDDTSEASLKPPTIINLWKYFKLSKVYIFKFSKFRNCEPTLGTNYKSGNVLLFGVDGIINSAEITEISKLYILFTMASNHSLNLQRQFRNNKVQYTHGTPYPTQPQTSDLSTSQTFNPIHKVESSSGASSLEFNTISQNLSKFTCSEVENILRSVEQPSNQSKTSNTSVFSQSNLHLTPEMNLNPLLQQQNVYLQPNPVPLFQPLLSTIPSRRRTQNSNSRQSQERSRRSRSIIQRITHHNSPYPLHNRPGGDASTTFHASSSLGLNPQRVFTTSTTTHQQIFNPHTSSGNGHRQQRGYIPRSPGAFQHLIQPSLPIPLQSRPIPRHPPPSYQEYMASIKRPTVLPSIQSFLNLGHQSSRHHRSHQS